MQLEPRIAPLGLEVRQIAALLAVCLALLEVWSTVSTAWTTGHLPQSYLDQPVDGAMPATCTQAAAQCPSNLITRLHGGERLLIQGSRTVLGPVGSIRVTIRFAWYPTRPAARTSFERPSIELCTVLKDEPGVSFGARRHKGWPASSPLRSSKSPGHLSLQGLPLRRPTSGHAARLAALVVTVRAKDDRLYG